MALTFLSPQFLYLLGAVPLVVALHFLRSRRTAVDVSALFLWQRAKQVVAKRRRFSPTWLLVAQLLFTALAAVALARPVLSAGHEPDRVVIIDTSASMAARARADENADTRLAEAIEQAAGLISGSGRLALIRAGSQATLLLPLSAPATDRNAALAALEAGDAAADIGGALDLADALLPGAEIHLFSDQSYELGQAEVHVVGEAVANVGIGALDIGIGQVFVGVVSSESGPVETGVALFRDGEPLASGSVLVPANDTGSITFPLPDLNGIIEARLEPAAGDALALDDVAYAGSRSLTVVTDDGHGALTRALAAVPNTTVTYSIGARLLQADLKVLTRGAEVGEEPGNYLVVSPPLNEPDYQVVSDWDRADPLLRFVDLSELVVGLAPDGPGWEPSAQWRVLARTGDLTPVIRVRDDEGVFELQFAFHPSQSDITLRPAFPALMANVVERLRTTSRVRLGEAPPRDLGAAVTAPAAGPLLMPGIYRLFEDGLREAPESALVGGEESAAGASAAAPVLLASLLSAGESRLPRSGELAGRGGGSSAAATPVVSGADDSSPADPDSESQGAVPNGVGDSGAGVVVAPGGAPTMIGVVLLVLAVLAMLLEWALYSGSLEALARRLGVRSSAT